MNAAAETILEQLGGAGRVSVMLGVTHCLHGENELRLKFKAGNAQVGNVCIITLDGTDTYSMTLGYQRGVNYREVSTQSFIYAESLRSVFESQTGLRLSL